LLRRNEGQPGPLLNGIIRHRTGSSTTIPLDAGPAREAAMDQRSAQIATICGCIDHCFTFAMWCEDFAQHVDPEDMVWGLDRAFDLLSDATRLQSFLALRKLDDFFGGVKPKPGDLTASDFGIDVPSVLGEVGNTFLAKDERERINKGVAHLTEELSLERRQRG
jgi:hypothetical protein